MKISELIISGWGMDNNIISNDYDEMIYNVL